jgi:two-component system response regulator AlgR
MRILIVDDEIPARSRLRGLLDEIGIAELAEAGDGFEALTQAQQFKPDVVLMDIRMPEMDGIAAARALATQAEPPAVIFTTAYSDHALEAFEAHAVDYLVKPIRLERLREALDHAQRPTRVQLGEIATQTESVRQQICARFRGELLMVAVANILYFQADQKYTSIHHLGGEVLIEESLKELQSEFSEQFTRIHRSTLVATACITGIVRDDAGHHCVRLQGCEALLEVSRRHLPELRKALRQRTG